MNFQLSRNKTKRKKERLKNSVGTQRRRWRKWMGRGVGFGKVGGEDVTSKINDFHHWKSQTMAGADCNWNETC